MKGYAKGVNFKTSADCHFAEGGRVSRPASHYQPGANKVENLKEGFAPNITKAEKDDLRKKFGAQYTAKEASQMPIKKADGGHIVKDKFAGPRPAVKVARDGFSTGNPKSGKAEIEKRFGPGYTKKGVEPTPAPSFGNPHIDVKKPKFARGGGVLGQIAAKAAPARKGFAPNRPAPAAKARSVPSFGSRPLFGKDPVRKAAGGMIECIPAKTRAGQLRKEAGEHVRDAKQLSSAAKMK